ncbi:MAG: response regulator [Rhodocyclaceae bacterium]|nr:response regulator [Rhodocyclaceae bacterium]
MPATSRCGSSWTGSSSRFVRWNASKPMTTSPAPVASNLGIRFKRLLFGTLRRRLILGVVLVNALIMILLVADLTERQNQELQAHQSGHALALARNIATSSAGWLAARDFSGLREIVGSQTRYPDLRFAMILDMQGHIVAHSEAARINQYVHDLPAPSPAGQPPEPIILSQDTTLIDVIAPVVLANQQLGWVRVGIGQEHIEAELAQIRRNGLLYTLAAVLFGSIVATLLGHWLTRRLHAIQKVADAVQAGDRSQRAHLGGTDEAATLAQAFDAMLDALAAREAALQESEGRFRALIESSLMPMLVTGDLPEAKVLMMNRRFTEVFGYTMTEVRDIQTWWPLAFPDPDSRREVQQRWQIAVDRMQAAGSPHIEPVSAEVTCKDGGTRFVEAHMTVRPGQSLVVFNDLTERRTAAQELEQHRQHLEEQVASRTADLARARDAAEAANRAKSVFLANMSHELRTPLNAVLGFAQLMARDPQLAASHRRELDIIDHSGRHLLSLINDVLEISRIEAGRPTVQNDTFDLPATLQAIEDMIRVRADAKGLALRVELPPGLPRHVFGDAPHLRQVLINLLGNAIKFTTQGEVCLRLSESNGCIRFEVEDTGPGIALEDQARVFDAFYQAANGAAKGDGAGLGLTISNNFVRLMGGQLSISSTPGQGSTFSFTLPLPPRQAVQDSSPRGRVVSLAAGQTGYRVLVVEDNADNRALLATLLRNVGFQVAEAENGACAVEQYNHWHPDFIWMDMRMPVLDGYEATRMIRRLPGGGEVKIVALTASAFEEDRPAILATGCDDMVTKPVDEDQFFAVMARLLGVKFDYANQPPAASASPAPDTPVDFSPLPDGLRAELARAAEILDGEAVNAVAEQLRSKQPALAQALTDLAANYRFDRIGELCRQSTTPTGSA